MFYMLIPPFLLHVYIYFSVSTIHVTPKIAVDFIYILYTRFFSRYFNILWFFVLFIQKTNVEISISCMIYSSFVFTPRRFHFPVGFFDLDLTDFNCYLFEVGALNSIVIHVHVFHFPFWDIGFRYISVDLNVIMRSHLSISEKNGIFPYMLNSASSASIGSSRTCAPVNYDFSFVGETKWKFPKHHISTSHQSRTKSKPSSFHGAFIRVM